MATPDVKTVDDYRQLYKVLIYGPYGSGKTSLAYTFPKPVWIDFENSTETLRNTGHGDTPLLRPKTMDEAEKFIEKVCDSKSPYETIVIDTANSMQVKQLAEHMLDKHRRGGDIDIDMPFQADYRKSTNKLSRIFYLLQACDKHVVIVSQQREDKDKEGKTVLAIRPDLTARLAELVGQAVDVVAYLKRTPGVGQQPASRVLYVNPFGKITAKNRLGIQATEIKNPTFESVFLKKGI